MASLPNPNPIDAGHMHRGGAVDHLGNSTIHCWACDSEQRVELYKMILGRHFGFGAPIYVKPFQKHSSTRGKVGRKGTYALCCNCGSLLAQDDGARRSLEANGFSPKGIMSEQAGYQLINRIVDDPEYPESEPASTGLPPPSRVRKLDAEVSPEPEAQEAEIVEPTEVTEVRQVEPEPTEPAVNDDPEVKRLREELAVKERFVAERLAERREAEEAEKREAEVERQIAELGARIAEVDEQVAELTPYAKVCKVVCPMCGEMSPFPYDVCPQCFKPQTNQDSRLKMCRCGKCGCVCGETDKSCSLCGAEFAD